MTSYEASCPPCWGLGTCPWGEPPAASPLRNECHETTTVVPSKPWRTAAWPGRQLHVGSVEGEESHSWLQGPSPLNDPLATRRNVFSRTFGDLASGLEGLCYGSAPKISEEGTEEDREEQATSSVHSVLSTRGTSIRDTRTLLHLRQRMEQKLPAQGGLCDLPLAPPPSPQPGPPAAPAAALSKLEAGVPSSEWPQPEGTTQWRTAAPTRPQSSPCTVGRGGLMRKVHAQGEGEHACVPRGRSGHCAQWGTRGTRNPSGSVSRSPRIPVSFDDKNPSTAVP